MFLSSAVIGVVAVHLLRTTGLLRFIPEQLDLIHLLASLK
ncbi:bacteriophage protein [Mycobacteroides abscessus 6G-0728-R]|nr:bacteriophage protein [Mycobacteroides abscessus subsp. bolletii 50594]EHM19215.1 bacteriophage protein [Mycobacteroides abscessus subsp. massiliense CCUG 48898 = JCM 15300]EIU47532.1 bacteriophage protein [Mycobacteroides abscessus 6G-0125-R]EIU49225.1 bacteriophage protein [Mycobacteroides abscessus 6G-0125-S]EIU59910.1 bacteriophage protein [Mycobacteroides abscessus 6G-0728-S]EIU64806.1 bacteriophage protein [Mycobacteroides abscessus 6G-1108]EIU96944.1 bacteriophage protein [Mycobacte